MKHDELVKALRNNADHYGFVGENGLVHLLTNAADAIEELSKQLATEQQVCDGYYYAYQHWMHQYIKDIENRVDAKPVDGDKFVDAIIKSYEQSRWIPVTERLPEEMKTVLVTDGKNVGWSFYVNDYGTMGFYSTWEITHWMPLPQPPEEK